MLEEARARMVDVETGFPSERCGRSTLSATHPQPSRGDASAQPPGTVKRRAPARAVVAKLRDPADLPHSDDKPPHPWRTRRPPRSYSRSPATRSWAAAMHLWTPGCCSGSRTRRRSHPCLRGRRTIPRPCRSGDEACAADRSDGAVQHEDLGSCVRLDVVGTHERHHRALGEALDRLD
jgi:hypothetical protein